jgi:hypothetical protein
VLRELGAPGFQEGNSSAQLSSIFAKLRGRRIDLSPIAAIDPRLFRPAALDKRGMLRLTGYFPSRPEQVNFDLAFQTVKGKWRLFGIGLNTSREQPVADAAPAGASVSRTAASRPAVPPMPRPRPQL